MFGEKHVKEAGFYFFDQKKESVFCRLCPHYCRIKEGERGKCRVRGCKDGKLFSLNYGVCASYCLDPIEKKPLYHFYPGSHIFSIGSVGCNFTCQFCQNWNIAQQFEAANTVMVTPEDITEIMEKRVPVEQRLGVAFTYNEPAVWYEFIYDTSRLIQEQGLKNVLVTNGFINPEPLEKLLPYIDAMNIDIKGFTEEFYQKYCGGSLKPVMKAVELAASHCHVEVTNLLIPELNDSHDDIQRMVEWIAKISPDIPLHISRYYPSYRMEKEATSEKKLKKAREIALEKLRYVYIGNLFESDYASTYCPRCGLLLINRRGFSIKNQGIDDDHKCRKCGEKILILG
ncbi:AmmeMemoRadiSam system radical SAM enzyme [Candidatus Contubernalis alkaliaceticus]|uniref:AmmeMemoRadiSam system radical SAM enzyme n=1 Tax=Candidatus Contubernalis alkaliaceticus TaxID=338645 RepID=UPI001F4BD52C|nr:AmmeMemoRadiSam system radical SAM enzyme [Candidatus Contubernalis alkalaceticus]UNC90976.1 AmmeMemoRadiSam system radical SAM enzyme [Candidatus Contubernalis alkalaceticus]